MPVGASSADTSEKVSDQGLKELRDISKVLTSTLSLSLPLVFVEFQHMNVNMLK